MKTIIFLGSYSGGGASTAIELFREMGIPCVSTSEILYEFIEKLDGVINSPILKTGQDKEGRHIRIDIAEECVKATFGSSVFPVAAANKIKCEFCESDVVVMDCFDISEHVFTRNWLGPEAMNVILNIRSNTEQLGIDGQQLLEPISQETVHTIQNLMTREGLKAELQKVLLSIDNNLNTL